MLQYLSAINTNFVSLEDDLFGPSLFFFLSTQGDFPCISHGGACFLSVNLMVIMNFGPKQSKLQMPGEFPLGSSFRLKSQWVKCQ